MITFKEYIFESGELRNHVVPTLKIGEKMFIGKRGDSHAEIYQRHQHEIDVHPDKKNLESGYYHLVEKKFYSRKEINQDTTQGLTRNQRFRKHGSE